MSFRIHNNNSVNNVKQDIDINKYLCIRIGDYKYTSCNSDVNNWLVCDGRSLLSSSYPELFNVIGTEFGSEGAGYFSLPDYRGRVPGAIGSGPGLTTRNLGSHLGEETHILTIPEMPTHQHTGTTDSAGAHIHGITDPGHTHSYLGVQSQGVASGLDNAAENSPRPAETSGSSTTGITVNTAGAHTHTFTTQNTGGSQAHNNMQPTLFGMNVLILSKIQDYGRLSDLSLKLIVEY